MRLGLFHDFQETFIRIDACTLHRETILYDDDDDDDQIDKYVAQALAVAVTQIASYCISPTIDLNAVGFVYSRKQK